jgi:cytochrome oxidase Cu insertion factor (SCO1/SenC/PrrC family)
VKGLVVFLAALLVAPALTAGREKPVAVGETAPDIVLRDQHGRPFRLADALGQRDFVVVAFYVKAFTGG